MKRILFIAAASFLLFSLFLSPPRAAAAETDEIFTAESINNVALAEGYIALSLPAARPMLRVSRPSGLIRFPAGTPNRNLYLALRSEITKTANGTNDKQYDDDIGGMSTVFAIPAAELIQVRGGEIAPGAFGEGAVLAVDGTGDWFESGYSFIIREDAGE